jgi:hypothetical protein
MQTERAEAFFLCNNGPISLKCQGCGDRKGSVLQTCGRSSVKGVIDVAPGVAKPGRKGAHSGVTAGPARCANTG